MLDKAKDFQFYANVVVISIGNSEQLSVFTFNSVIK